VPALLKRLAPTWSPYQTLTGKALRELLAAERYDWIVVAAATSRTDGLSAAEVAWLLEHAPGEVVVLRPADEAALAAA
jgi:hypothetical protein